MPRKNNIDIVISGIAGRFPDSDSVTELYDNLLNGVDLCKDNDRWPMGYCGLPAKSGLLKSIGKFDAEFFGIPETDATPMDPITRMLHETVYEAILDSGTDPKDLRGTNTALLVGHCFIDGTAAIREDESDANEFWQLIVHRIAHAFDIKGPCYQLDSACASSMNAVADAYHMLRVGVVDRAIVCGVNLVLRPSISGAFNKLTMLSLKGSSKCLDDGANGYCRSEANITLLLQPKDSARRVYASILNANSNNNGFTLEGLHFPNSATQSKLMKRTYSEIGLDPVEINYAEGHITGTQAGDPEECISLIDSLRPNGSRKPLEVGCLKASIGHTESASGHCAIVKVLSAFQRKEIPGNINYKTPNRKIPSLFNGMIKPVLKRRPFNEKIVAVNSFGFGGTNAHCVLRSYYSDNGKAKIEIPRLVTFMGRTREGLISTFTKIASQSDKCTNEFYNLLSNVSNIEKGFPFKGYTILTEGQTKLDKFKVISNLENHTKPPIVFAFPGLGMQWKGMAKGLFSFKPFADAIDRASKIINKYDGLNLERIILEDDPNESMRDALIGLTALGIGLLEICRAIQIEPDIIIGYSYGEVLCAYADGCISFEETIEAAYSIGTILNRDNPKHSTGGMAVCGLSWSQFEARGEKLVYPACHNSPNNITIAGDGARVEQVCKQLDTEGIQTWKVNSCGKAIHCPWAGPYEQLLLNELKLRPTRPRSSKWISTSVPEQKRNEYLNFDAKYAAFNLMSPVHFAEATSRVPSNALVLEIGPASMLTTLFKQNPNTKDVRTVNFMRRNNDDNVSSVLSAIGELYLSGHRPNISNLYPKPIFPAPSDTPSIAPLINWDHSKDWLVTMYPEYFNPCQSHQTFTIDLMNKEFSFLTDHFESITMFPATGYLYVAWQCWLKVEPDSNGRAIEFTDCSFKRATFIKDSVDFKVIFATDTGKFDIFESNSVCMSGTIRLSTKSYEEEINFKSPSESCLQISKKEIYREFKIRGYDYGPHFQGISVATADGSWAQLNSRQHWISLVDTFLQVQILARKDRNMAIPTFIGYFRFDPKKLEKIHTQTTIPVKVDYYSKYANSIGLIMGGLEMTTVSTPGADQKAIVKDFRFEPFFDFNFNGRLNSFELQYVQFCEKLLDTKNELTEELKSSSFAQKYTMKSGPKYNFLRNLIDSNCKFEALKTKLKSEPDTLSQDLIVTGHLSYIIDTEIQLILQNITRKDVDLAEFNASDSLLSSTMSESFRQFRKNANQTVVHSHKSCKIPESIGRSVLTPLSKFVDVKGLSDLDLIIHRDKSTALFLGNEVEAQDIDYDQLIKYYESCLKSGGFLLLNLRTHLSKLEIKLVNDDNILITKNEELSKTVLRCKKAISSSKFILISDKTELRTGQTVLLLRKSSSRIDNNLVTVEVRLTDYNWIEDIKKALRETEDSKIWLYAKDSPFNGLLGYFKCLRDESIGHRLRCVFDPTDSKASIKNLLTSEIIQKDLAINVRQGNEIGTLTHTLLDTNEMEKLVSAAYFDVQTIGDLRSLRWFEAEHSHLMIPKTVSKALRIVRKCDVHYSALNFRDIMLATGRISLAAYPPCSTVSSSNIGIEFAGVDSGTGKRIMGYAENCAIGSSVDLNNSIIHFEVPNEWSLQDAATVPIAYLTVYYALIMRGQIQRGHKVLIHAASGAVGLAAIHICEAFECQIYATVGSKAKREFLMSRFPNSLTNDHFASSRSTDFEQYFMNATNGTGFDIVLNSLSEDKLQASLNCLAIGGRFLELGKYDITQNNPIDLFKLGNGRQFHAICLTYLKRMSSECETGENLLNQLKNLMNNGLKSGQVKPLNSVVFENDNIQDAFRFMATGSHIGKVLVKMPAANGINNSLIPSVPQTYFDAHKSYLIIGGLGGLGIELVHWMIIRGARKFVLSSRSGIRNKYQELSMDLFQRNGAQVIISANDAFSLEDSESLIKETLQLGPIGGIFNTALVLIDQDIMTQTVDNFKIVAAAKATTTIHMDRLSQEMGLNLDYFMCCSSISAGFGNRGQSMYGFANSVMENVCNARRAKGLHGLAVQWGPLADVGYIAERYNNEIDVLGGIPQKLNSIFEILDKALRYDSWTISSCVYRAETGKKDSNSADDLMKCICHIVGIDKETWYSNSTTSLGEYGMDSLMGQQIKQLIATTLKHDLDNAQIRELTLKGVQGLLESNAKQ